MPTQRAITLPELEAALAGENPKIGHPISQAELGRRLASHRQGRLRGRPYTQAAISMYVNAPEKQSDDFANAFRSWRLAAAERQDSLKVLSGGMTVDELLAESAGQVILLGEGEPQGLFVLGTLPAGSLILPSVPIPAVVICRAEIAECPCGRRFVKKTPRHRYCAPDCPARS